MRRSAGWRPIASSLGLILSLSKDEAAAQTVKHLVLRQAQDEVNSGGGAGLSPARTDVFTLDQRSAVMRAVPARNTTPELEVRRLLTSLGARYRLHRRDLPGSPDIVLGPRKLAIFVHGCFWHGHECARGARVPKSNTGYWLAKIARNRARDATAVDALTARGWRPEVIWECELKDVEALTARLRSLLEHPCLVKAR